MADTVDNQVQRIPQQTGVRYYRAFDKAVERRPARYYAFMLFLSLMPERLARLILMLPFMAKRLDAYEQEQVSLKDAVAELQDKTKDLKPDPKKKMRLIRSELHLDT